jgi:ribA/ribD-fused uncharacterized protein
MSENHKLDTDTQVFFYEQDFYVLSNFSAFNLRWKMQTFPTSEHAYHWSRFMLGWHMNDADGADAAVIAGLVKNAPSAHEAFKIAQEQKHLQHPEWDNSKVGVMRAILTAKAHQHEYVRRKLLATGDRELIEDSWRDDFWGWGPNRDGKNMLGKLWMEVRAELREAMRSKKIGDRVSLEGEGRHNYCIQAINDRFAIMTRTFNLNKGHYLYIIADREKGVRGAANLIFGPPMRIDSPEGASEALSMLMAGEMAVSKRNCRPMEDGDIAAIWGEKK